MSQVDRLFLRTFCLECSQVRAELDFDAVVDDEFIGKNGQELRVFTALSDSACQDLLSRFELSDATFPVIQSHDGADITKAKNVIMYLRRNGMTKE